MKHILLFLIAFFFVLESEAQVTTTRQWISSWRFEDANEVLAAMPDEGRVVFMGNSITDFWLRRHAEFFYDNGFICRGISAQTTPQMLLRIHQDVVETGASTLVILAGTNDIAGNTGYCPLPEILGNIAGMCEIAQSNGIRVLVCSLLPVHQYSWAKQLKPYEEIPKFNAMLKEYADKKGIEYIDFFSAMVDTDPDNFNGLPKELASDGVHPTKKGYMIMEEIVLKSLAKEVAAHKKAHEGESLRLMTYNVKTGNGMDGNTYKYQRTAEVINSCYPDVVAVQELDSLTARSHGHYVLGELAKLTGMIPTYAPAIEYDGGKYGIGMLSRENPLSVERVPLPGREESRTLLMVEFRDYIYCCTHFSLTEEDRIASVKIVENSVKKFAKGKNKPVFLAGDLNDEPDSPAIKSLTKYFDILNDSSVLTCPADVPQWAIDYILRWKESPKGELDNVATSLVGNSCRTSDHRPVVVVLK